MAANPRQTALDANEAVARIAYAVNDVIAIYPITPASPIGEWADLWSAQQKPNLWGHVPQVVEMQSEAGAAGAVHGALQAGALTTTFTASQGLLLMIPNMYKIAGELTPMVMHVAARSVAAHALSIFGDQSDVMAVRQTGYALLASNSVQESADMALIAQRASLEARVPFIHFFDGFRTSHEINKVELIDDAVIREMIPQEAVYAHRERALSPDNPVLRGTAQNPDAFFQSREAGNPFYLACPETVQASMDRFAELTGRSYRLFEYFGDPNAETVLILMGSGAGAVKETVEHLNAQGHKLGCILVRLYRPFAVETFLKTLPESVKTAIVLDRTKEPGSVGEPLYLDVVSALQEGDRGQVRCFGGRYGLSSKEFTPAMIKGIVDAEQAGTLQKHFTVGINDDVTHLSVEYDESFHLESPDNVCAVFYGLGSDGTVGANKNTIKIIGERTELYTQGYFVYDSKKAGSVTVSHLRFGPKPIDASYLVQEAGIVACHQFQFLERLDVLETVKQGGTFLLNAPYPTEEVWDRLPNRVQKQILDKDLTVYVIDAYRIAREAGLGNRINTIMQTCFFKLSQILDEAIVIDEIKDAIKKTYGKRGASVVERNNQAVDQTLENLHLLEIPGEATGDADEFQFVPDDAPEFVRNVTSMLMAGKGERLPVSAMPADGTFPTGTAQYERRGIAAEVPVWDEDLCIQCGKCVFVCPHAVIRSKVCDADALSDAPEGFKSTNAKWANLKEKKFILQVAPDDCTGCTLCVQVCPVKDKSEIKRKAINMEDRLPILEESREGWDYFLNLPEFNRQAADLGQIKDVQLLEPLFEYSGACAGCGETPYIKLMSQLFGDRAVIANATGCSSIYGGNLPTTPWTKNGDGRGPAWSNSLFEDNAEFGLGMRVAIDQQRVYAEDLLKRLSTDLGQDLVDELLTAEQDSESAISLQRERVAALRERLQGMESTDARDLLQVSDTLVKRSVWILGGDGWAYDIGYGGLDHVVASAFDVNILVMDTEVYSNTGGQMSKATPRAAVAKFAASGKPSRKKDLGLMATSYQNAYVARIAMGASDIHTLKVLREAESYPGPSLIIAYSHCIAHGYHLSLGMQQQKAAVQSGYWPLFRYDPRLIGTGKNPFQLDSKAPSMKLKDYIYNETRFAMLAKSRPDHANHLLEAAQKDVWDTWQQYERLAKDPAMNGNGQGGAAQNA